LKFNDTEFLVYSATGLDGINYSANSYILAPLEEDTTELRASAQKKSDELLAGITQWERELHVRIFRLFWTPTDFCKNEILVFDQGYWQKNAELWQNIQKSNWEDVILEKEKKQTIIDDVIGFFNGQKRYEEFNVPWKVWFLHSLRDGTDQLRREVLSFMVLLE
jgi:transitional endoplasmic reticulum ATPase